ncbi:hypothetical protein ACWD74_35780, partial [Streptomyces fagopyri]
MEALVQTLAVVATMANAVVYGTDIFSAIVQRPALAHVDSIACRECRAVAPGAYRWTWWQPRMVGSSGWTG